MRILGLVCVTLGASWPMTAWAESSALPLTSLRAADALAVDQADRVDQPESDVPDPGAMVEPPQPTTTTLQPTSSKAPPSTAPLAAEPEPEPELEPVAEEEPEEPPPELPSRLAERDSPFHRHALGAHGGIVVVPTWLLSSWLATHSNALCRGPNIGNFAAGKGLTNQDGCNFYVGGDYVYRFSRVLDVAASVQYQRAKLPDALWLDKSRNDGTAASLEAADYTEVDLGLLALEVDFIARAPIVVTKDVEFGIGGGGGLGLGVVFGGVYQTALGSAPAGYTADGGRTDTCQTIEDLADLTRCTPRWDAANDGDDVPPDQNDLSSPNAELFANCTTHECNKNDLRAFGYRREQGGIPPVIPVVNLILSMRLIIKDTVGITLNGGFNTGFYFGGGMQVFFGKRTKDDMTVKPPVEEARRRKRVSVGRV